MSLAVYRLGQHEIVNRRKAVVGYEFGLSSRDGVVPHGAANVFGDGLREWANGGLVFLKLDRESILDGVLPGLGSDKVIVEIGSDLHNDVLVLDALREAVRAGVKICLLVSKMEDMDSPLFSSASFVKVDIGSIGLANLGLAMSALKSTPATLSARSVETEREFLACVAAGFVQLQGGYISACVDTKAGTELPNIATLLEVLDKVGREEDAAIIEESFKRDAALAYRLFKNVNSVGFGLATKIHSVRHALSVMGYRNLYRWLVVMMATSVASVPGYSVALRRCITRARLLELLGSKQMDRESGEQLFLVGMFSMLDTLLGMKLDDVMQQLPLDDDVESAVLRGSGRYADYLLLAIGCEQNDADRVRGLQERLQIKDRDLICAQIEAISWAADVAGIN